MKKIRNTYINLCAFVVFLIALPVILAVRLTFEAVLVILQFAFYMYNRAEELKK